MSGYRESDQTDEVKADVGMGASDQVDANDVARRRLAYRTKPDIFDCEHSSDDPREAEFINKSAEILKDWEERPERADRIKMMRDIGEEMRKAHAVELNPHFKAAPLPSTAEGKIMGETTPDGRQVTVEKSLFDKSVGPHDALEATLHESRHVEQIDEVKKWEENRFREVDPWRAAWMEWATEEYRPGNDAAAIADGDAETFAAETAARILEKKAEFEARAGETGRELRGGVSSPGDWAARQRLAADAEGREP